MPNAAERFRRCHHQSCARLVGADSLACRAHWKRLPKELRDRVRELQPVDAANPGRAWLDVLLACHDYWERHPSPWAVSA